MRKIIIEVPDGCKECRFFCLVSDYLGYEGGNCTLFLQDISHYIPCEDCKQAEVNKEAL